MTFVQVVILITSMSVYGVAPIGITEREISTEVQFYYFMNYVPLGIWFHLNPTTLLTFTGEISPFQYKLIILYVVKVHVCFLFNR